MMEKVLPRAIGAPLGHQGRSLRCPRPPRTLRSRRARPDPHESPLLCGRRQRQLFSAAGARRLPRGWAAEGLTGQVPGVAAGRSNVARGWARGAPLAGCRFPGRPPDGSGLRRESITYDRYLAGPSSRGSPKRPPHTHTLTTESPTTHTTDQHHVPMDPRAAELMPIHAARLALTRSVTQTALSPPHSQPRALRHTTVLSNIMLL